MPRILRTIVTGHDEHGQSIVTGDRLSGPGSPNVYVPVHDQNVCLANIWSFDSIPTHAPREAEAGERFTLKPARGGAIFRYIEIPPESIRRYDNIDAYFQKMDAGDDQASGARKKHPAM